MHYAMYDTTVRIDLSRQIGMERPVNWSPLCPDFFWEYIEDIG
jgi:hypothetical protein